MNMNEVTAATLIGHDLSLLRWCLENARARAGIPHDWLVVNWIPAESPEVAGPIAAWCKAEDVHYASFTAEPKPTEGDTTPWFLRQLYMGWNLTHSLCETKWTARMGSDQFFSKGWLKNLMESAERYGERAVYHCHTIESPLARHSRHEICDFGTTWQTFDHQQFEMYAAERAYRFQHELAIPGNECNLYYRHPARGLQQRPDGVTFLMHQKLYAEFGPMDDKVNAEGVTGDVEIFDRMTDAGVPQYLVPSCTSYHLVAAESREIQK